MSARDVLHAWVCGEYVGRFERDWVVSDFAQHRDGKFSKEIESMVRENSTIEISGKPEIMTKLALGLSDAAEVPEELRTMFDELIKRAAY